MNKIHVTGAPLGIVDCLCTMVSRASDDQVFNAFFGHESPLHSKFLRFLGAQFIEHMVNQPGVEVDLLKKTFSTALSQPSTPASGSFPHQRVHSLDDQVEVAGDEYDQIPVITIDQRRSDSLDLPDLPADSETKSASPPSPSDESAEPSKKFSFHTEEKESGDRLTVTINTPTHPDKSIVSPSRAKGNLSLDLEDISDGTIDRIIDYTLEGENSPDRNQNFLAVEDEVKASHLLPLVDNASGASDDSSFLEALLSSTEQQLEDETKRQVREMEALNESQLRLLSEDLPHLTDIMFTANPQEIQAYLVQKVNLCNTRFNMQTQSKVEGEAIDKKTGILNDILEFFVKSVGDEMSNSSETSRRNKKKRKNSDSAVLWYSADVLGTCLDMIEYHIFRPLPTHFHGPELGAMSGSSGGNDDDGDAFEDAEWVHLEIVYKVLLFLVSANQQIDKKYLGRMLKDRFIGKFMELFLTEDRRERECLKTILHRIYGRFMGIRKMIRIIISHHCYITVYGQRRNSFGISEFLQILVSVIHGYATPVKDEHKDFLRNVLLPLHKCRELVRFHEELGACMYQFVFKDPNVAPVIFGGLLKFWPNGATLKQEILLTEMKNIIAIMVANSSRFDWTGNAAILQRVVEHLCSCMKSRHHMVAQRAISLWADDAMQAFCDRDQRGIWLQIGAALAENSVHWNDDVRLATDELVQYMAAKDPNEWQEVWTQARSEWENSTRKASPEFAMPIQSAEQRQRALQWTRLRAQIATRSRARSRADSASRRGNSRGRTSRRANSPTNDRGDRSRSRSRDAQKRQNGKHRNGYTKKRQNSNQARADTAGRGSTSSSSPPRGKSPNKKGRGLRFGRNKKGTATPPENKGRWGRK